MRMGSRRWAGSPYHSSSHEGKCNNRMAFGATLSVTQHSVTVINTWNIQLVKRRGLLWFQRFPLMVGRPCYFQIPDGVMHHGGNKSDVEPFTFWQVMYHDVGHRTDTWERPTESLCWGMISPPPEHPYGTDHPLLALLALSMGFLPCPCSDLLVPGSLLLDE